MSFGYSISDVISLAQSAWNVVQNSRKACGEHDELTREVSSLHVVLKRLENEVAKPESPLNKPDYTYIKEIEVMASGCHRVLKILDQILEKYNALSEAERTGRKLWQKIKFGNGQMADLADYRSKVVYYTSAMSVFLNMVSIGTMGNVEKQMNDAGDDLKEIKQAVNGITAHLIAKDRSEGSVLTAYADDDRMIWKELRRELIRNGFPSSVIRKHKDLIKAYIEDLGARGLLDDPEPQAMSGPTAAQNHFITETPSHLTVPSDVDTAGSQSSTLLAAEKEGIYVESAETNHDPLLAPEVQSMTELSSILDPRPDAESKVQLTKDGVVDAQAVTSVIDTKEDPALTTCTERPRRIHCLKTLPVERPSAQYPIGASYTEAEAAVQVTNSIDKDNDPFSEVAYPDSPAELIRVASDAWFNEYLLTTQYPNINPSLGAKTTLLNLLVKLKAVDIEVIGWSNELKACRACLIKQIGMRLNTLARISQTLRKHHVCRPRCFCKSDASENAKSVKDTERKLLNLSREIHDGALKKNLSPRLITVRRVEVSGALHRIWHDHHDRVAPLCLNWATSWGRRIWEQSRFLKRLPMNVELMKLIGFMRENKGHLETLHLDGDVELTARREQLIEDIKLIVSSLRIFKSDARWRWKTLDTRTKDRGQRVCVNILWVKSTIVSAMGIYCEVCSATERKIGAPSHAPSS